MHTMNESDNQTNTSELGIGTAATAAETISGTDRATTVVPETTTIMNAKRALSLYLDVRRQTGDATPASSADADHSSLLERLLRGEPLYRYPPPRAMSYPWYDLLDAKSSTAFDPTVTRDGNGIIIEQSLWNLIATVTPNEEYVAGWPNYDLVVRLRRRPGVSYNGFTVTVESTENHTVENPWEVVSMPPVRARDQRPEAEANKESATEEVA